MSPNKIARHDDGPGGVTLLGQVLKLEHLDIEPEVFLEEQEVDTVLQHGLNLEEDPDESISDLRACIKELSYPCTPQLQRLDSIADQVEIERLFGLQVLLTDTLPPEAKSLSTRLVRSWREKPVWLRRSRLVAREFSWLQPDREALFSPASSNIARVLPVCYLAWREHMECLPWTRKTRFQPSNKSSLQEFAAPTQQGSASHIASAGCYPANATGAYYGKSLW